MHHYCPPDLNVFAHSSDWFDSRQLSLPIFGLLTMLSAMWAIVAMEYGKWKRSGGPASAEGALQPGGGGMAGPVDMSRRVRLTVNVSCGLLALLSSVMLVVIHSSLYLTIANFVADKVWDVSNDVLKVRSEINCPTRFVVDYISADAQGSSTWSANLLHLALVKPQIAQVHGSPLTRSLSSLT